MRKLLLILIIIFSQSVYAEISVSVDRDPIVVDESFQLIFESDNDVDGQPDFTPLNKSFTVLNSSTRSSTQIINGKVKHSLQWILSVLPKKAGKIKIPSIRFGKQVSQPRVINIVNKAPSSKSNAGEGVFLDVVTSTATPYVQAQVIYSVKLYRAIPTSNATLSEPAISGGQAVIDKLGEDKSYEKQLNGKRYNVIERNYVIFPQNSGKLKIEPLIFQARIGAGGFFNLDPFGPQPQSIVKRSEEVILDVKPIPDSFTGKTWLPAENMTIQEQWSVSPDKLKQGEAVTRTLILTANGLAASNLPAIDDNLPDSFKHYPDQPEFQEENDSNGFIGIRKEKMAIIAMQGGDYILPAIRIPWWNTRTGKIKYAELPERTLHVEATVNSLQSNESQSQGSNLILPDTETPSDNVSQPETVVVETTSPFWKWVSFFIFLLWILTVMAWWFSQNKKHKETEKKEKAISNSGALKELKKACKANNATKARQALIDWARNQWPKEHIHNIEQIKKYTDSKFDVKLDELNNVLYGRNEQPWNGMIFLKAFEEQSFRDKRKKITEGKLEPLYKT